MAVYKCSICGEIYDEDQEPVKFEDLPDDWVCPLCRSPKSAFVKVGEEPAAPVEKAAEDAPAEVVKPEKSLSLAIPSALVRHDGGAMDDIYAMAETGKSLPGAMDTELKVTGFEDILILGGQLARPPLDDDADVSLRTVIGKKAKKPMVLEAPVFVSHMSFGALSGRAKIALAKGSAAVKTAMCSGEGGALYDEMVSSYRYIFELAPNKYSFDSPTLEGSHAVEIKIGQGTKPGMGGHLPGDKVTHIIATMRGKSPGKDIQSPSRFPGVDSPEDLKALVDMLRDRSGGLPIGVKIAAGHIEEDLEFISKSGCDFITIDGRGGATGSSPKFLRDNSSVPTVYALARARKYMDEHKMPQELIITGGFRTSGDVAKALAMGADAVAMASAPLMALGCQRYRICGSGKCPMGIATQDPELEDRLDVEAGSARVANFLSALMSELRTFARVTGHEDIHDLSLEDLCATDSEISQATGIRHA
ncbi:MAG: alpha-hydroxy-acid oxidizing protein [Candidatus Methanomethylophilaceae archaeon]|nr:alpha-hydroxy-acid oxidizing protein [Candidatus Methanomethylophilaceae archaeon]